eukprot:TRINITY_DN2827_c0_g1_i1.p1 TRINITY_DN2827_c0_g1~~TRINITY_DN2827_c0_g1_i1.p1  ORF type:complete len:2810 (-),score=803.77 TRINITY_DN2827_c0_g1_i1:174-8603(-)
MPMNSTWSRLAVCLLFLMACMARAAPVPRVTFASLNKNTLIGNDISLAVSFDSDGSLGFAPFIDLAYDGLLQLNSISYLGMSVDYTTNSVTTSCIPHPWAYDSTSSPLTICPDAGAAGGPTTVISIKVPFLSFASTQTPAKLNIKLSWSDDAASAGADTYTFHARAGFEHGGTPAVAAITDPSIVSDQAGIDTWSAQGYFTTSILTTEHKIIGAAGGETVAAPWATTTAQYSCTAAPSTTIPNLQMGVPLPNCAEFVSWQVYGDGNSADLSTPIVTSESPSTASDNGNTLTYTNTQATLQCVVLTSSNLTCTWDSATGSGKSTDLRITYTYRFAHHDCLEAAPIDPGEGSDSKQPGDAVKIEISGVSDYQICDGENCEWQSTASGGNPIVSTSWSTVRSVAVQSSIEMRDDQGSSGYTPGDAITNKATFQVGEYHQVDDLALTMTLRDGQQLDITQARQPRLTVDDILDNVVPAYTLSHTADGLDVVTVDIKQTLIANGAPSAIRNISNGIFDVDAVILDQYLVDVPDRTRSVDHGQSTGHDVVISSSILSPQQAVINNVTDDSSAKINVKKSSILHTIYALDGQVCDPQPCAHLAQVAEVNANQEVTFRVRVELPSTDAEHAVVKAYLPYPVFTVPGDVVVVNTNSNSAPPDLRASVGPDDTFQKAGYSMTVASNVDENAMIITLGTIEDTDNQPHIVDVLFTLTSSTKPFTDGLTISSLGVESEAGIGDIVDFVQVELLEPVLRIRKGAVSSSNPSSALVPGATACNQLDSGTTVTDTWLDADANHYGCNFAQVDGSDDLQFYVTIWNTGRAKAYDSRLYDTLPDGLVAGSVTVVDGTGAQFQHSGDLFDASTGLTLDPIPGVNADSGKNVVIVRVQCRTKSDLDLSGASVTNKAALLHYGSWIASENFIALHPSDDSADVIFASPSIAVAYTTSLNTTEFDEFDDSSHDLQIGEELYSHITVTVPQGSVENLRIKVNAPDGLDVVEAFLVSTSDSITLEDGAIAANTAVGTIDSTTNTLSIALGQVLNTDTTSDARSNPATMVFRVTSVLADQESNSDGLNLAQTVTLGWGEDGSQSSSTSIDVVEPTLRLSCSRTPRYVDGNDFSVLKYKILNKNTRSSADAYNVEFIDDVDDEFVSLVPDSVAFANSASSVLASIDNSDNTRVRVTSAHLEQGKTVQVTARVLASNDTVMDSALFWKPTIKYTNFDGTRTSVAQCNVRLYTLDPVLTVSANSRSLHPGQPSTARPLPVLPCEVVTMHYSVKLPEGHAESLRLRVDNAFSDDYDVIVDMGTIALVSQPATVTFDTWEPKDGGSSREYIYVYNLNNKAEPGSDVPLVFSAEVTVKARSNVPGSQLQQKSTLAVKTHTVSSPLFDFALEAPVLTAEMATTNEAPAVVQMGDVVPVTITIAHDSAADNLAHKVDAGNVVVSLAGLASYASVVSLATTFPGATVNTDAGTVTIPSFARNTGNIVIDAKLRMTETCQSGSVMPLLAQVTYSPLLSTCSNAPRTTIDARTTVTGTPVTLTSVVEATSNGLRTAQYNGQTPDIAVSESVQLLSTVTIPRGFTKSGLLYLRCCSDRDGDFQLDQQSPYLVNVSAPEGITFSRPPVVSSSGSTISLDLGDITYIDSSGSTPGTLTFRAFYSGADSGKSGDSVSPSTNFRYADNVEGPTEWHVVSVSNTVELVEPVLKITATLVDSPSLVPAGGSVECIVTLSHDTSSSKDPAYTPQLELAAPLAGSISDIQPSTVNTGYATQVTPVFPLPTGTGNATAVYQWKYNINATSTPVTADRIKCGGTVTYKSGVRSYSKSAQAFSDINTPPVATDDNARVVMDSANNRISITANDVDHNGNLDLSSITLLSSPSHGTVTLSEDNPGEVIYTCTNPGYTGPDYFTYTIKDDMGAVSNIATVVITIRDPTAITGIVTVGGMEFAVIDNTSPSSKVIGCQDQSLPMPGGWSLAQDSALARSALLCHPFGTMCVVLADGTGLTSKLEPCGNSTTNLVTETVAPDGVTEERYGVGSCDARVFISRKAQSHTTSIINPGFTVSNTTDSEGKQVTSIPKWNNVGAGFGVSPVRFLGQHPTIVVTGSNTVSGAAQDIIFDSTVASATDFTVGVWARHDAVPSSDLENDILKIAATVTCSDGTQGCVDVISQSNSFAVASDEWQYRQVVFKATPGANTVQKVTVSLTYQGDSKAFFAAPYFGFDDGNLLNPGSWEPFQLGYTPVSDHAPRVTIPPPMYPAISVQSSGQANKLGSSDELDIHGAIQVVQLEDYDVGDDTILYISGWSKSSGVNNDTSGLPPSTYSVHVDVFYADGTAKYGVVAPFTPNQDWHFSDGYLFIAKPLSHVQVVTLFNHADGVAVFDEVSVRLIRGGCSAGVGVSVGDPHLFTFDGLPYDLQLEGEFTMAKDSTIDIQTRFSRAGIASVTSAVAVRYADKHTISLVRSSPGHILPVLAIDGTVIEQGSTSGSVALARVGDVGSIMSTGALSSPGKPLTYTLSFPGSDHSISVEVRVSSSDVQFMRVRVSMPTSSRGRTSGLLGDFDGDRSNDIVGGDINAFGDSQRISQPASSFRYEQGESTETFTDMAHGRQPLDRASMDPALVKRAQEVCAGYGLVGPALTSCEYDVLVTEDASFADGYSELNSDAALQIQEAPTAIVAKVTNLHGNKSTGAVAATAAVLGVCVVLLLVGAAILVSRKVVGNKNKTMPKVRETKKGARPPKLTDIRHATEEDNADKAASSSSTDGGAEDSTPLILRRDAEAAAAAKGAAPGRLPPLSAKKKKVGGDLGRRSLSQRRLPSIGKAGSTSKLA